MLALIQGSRATGQREHIPVSRPNRLSASAVARRSSAQEMFVVELDVNEIGPSLRFATAKVTQLSQFAPPVDPWSTDEPVTA